MATRPRKTTQADANAETTTAAKPEAKAKAAPKAARAKAPATTKSATRAKAPAKPRVAAPEPAAEPAPSRPARSEEGVLERGDIFFLYRPTAAAGEAHGLADVQRFHVVLRPDGGESARWITIGRKTLPAEADRGRSYWAFVDRVVDSADSMRGLLSGEAGEAGPDGDVASTAALPAGEGVYAIVRRGRDSVLAYALELPEEPGEVQDAFAIAKRGHYVVSMKNPEAEAPAGTGLNTGRVVEFPEELQAMFGSRKWHPAEPVAFLDHEGAEMVLIAGEDRVGPEAGVDLEPQPEDESTAEVFDALQIDRSDRVMKPLIEGTWG